VNRFVLALLLSVLPVVSTLHPQTQKNNPRSANSPAQKSRSFIDWVLDFLSISYTPGAQKGPTADVADGQVWVADLKNGSTHLLNAGGSFRSPVFLAGSGDVLALSGNDVVRIPSAGGDARKIGSVEGVVKLVGVGSHDPGKVLVLLRNESGSHPRVALLAIDTGSITNLPYDPNSSQDLQFVEDLEGWSRSYGESRVYVKRQSKEDLAGTVEWSDVFLDVPGRQPLNVSQCKGVNCGQPSLSQDGTLLVYVKEDPNGQLH
jgi:hypothetical protein